MAKYHVHGTVTGSVYIGTIEADNEADACREAEILARSSFAQWSWMMADLNIDPSGVVAPLHHFVFKRAGGRTGGS